MGKGIFSHSFDPFLLRFTDCADADAKKQHSHTTNSMIVLNQISKTSISIFGGMHNWHTNYHVHLRNDKTDDKVHSFRHGFNLLDAASNLGFFVKAI